MSDLISREAAIEAVRLAFQSNPIFDPTVKMATSAILAVPAVQPVTVDELAQVIRWFQDRHYRYMAVQPDAAALDRARPALAEALAALSWAKANLQSLAAQCGQEGATFPMVDRAIQSVSDNFYSPGKEVI